MLLERKQTFSSIAFLANSSRASVAFPMDLLTETTTAYLKELTIEKYKLNENCCRSLGTLLQKSTSLQTLRLSNVTLQGDLSELGASIRGPSLVHLELSDVRLSEESLIFILDAVIESQTLLSLTLENMGLGDKQMPAIAKLVERNTCLQSLNLNENNFAENSIKVLAERLIHNTNLRELSLALNPVGNNGALYLSQALQENATLQECDLEHAEIWSEGCLALAKGLSRMSGLKRLLLEGNEMELCGRELLESVKQNMVLTYLSGSAALSVSYDDYDAESAQLWKEVEYWLKLNRGNRRILTTPNALPLWPVVLGTNKDPDVLYYILRHAPHVLARQKTFIR